MVFRFKNKSSNTLMLEKRAEDAFQCVDDIRQKRDTLIGEIVDIDSEIECLESTIQSDKETIEDYEERIAWEKREIAECQEKISRERKIKEDKQERFNKLELNFDVEYKKWKELMNEIQISLWKDFEEYIKTLSENNSMLVPLFPNSRTVPIMDGYYHSDKDFLLLSSMNYGGVVGIDLIVTRGFADMSISGDITMTELKQVMNIVVFDYNEQDPKYPPAILRRKIIHAFKNKNTTDKILLFDQPMLLRAQIKENRTGYGSEWCGPDSVYQGTLYGETTPFMIVGCRCHK